MRVILLLLLVLLGACSTGFEREVRSEPKKAHNLEKDRVFCREYAERYGVISLEPMLGEKAQSQPDRPRRKFLYQRCMQDKGYGF